MSDASLLKELQHVDLEILRISKKLREIPERELLEKTREKLAEVGEKSKQVSAMRSSCEVEMQKLSDEDDELAKRAEELQSDIDTSSDFRMVDKFTRELEGVAKRRNKVEFEHSKLVERSDKISEVEDQVADATSKLEAQEASYLERIDEAEGSVRSQIDELKEQHRQIADQLPRELLEEYAKLLRSKNGIAVGTLQGDHCSACRVEFPEGKLLQLRNGPEITTCPQCHRILVVDKEQEDA